MELFTQAGNRLANSFIYQQGSLAYLLASTKRSGGSLAIKKTMSLVM
jgi:hypothetical protein